MFDTMFVHFSADYHVFRGNDVVLSNEDAPKDDGRRINLHGGDVLCDFDNHVQWFL